MSKKKPSPFRKFAARWGRDLVPVAAGAALGLVLAFVLIGTGDTPAPAPPRQSAPQARAPAPKPPGPQASRPQPRVVALPRPEPVPSAPAVRPPPPVAPAAGLPAWRRFAAHHAPASGRPMIAVVIDDMGLDRRRSERAVRLPGPLTLAYLTYARDLAHQTAAARTFGHELLVHLPMEPEGAVKDPGPNVLKTGLAPAELDRRIDWALARFDGFVGINNHMGSRFTADPAGMARVMTALGRQGLLWLDSRTTRNSAGPRVARDFGVPFAERSVFLDNENDSSQVRARLAELERAARRTGYAVAIGHPRDATLEALGQWLPTLAAAGFALVPVSAVVRHRQTLQAKAIDGRP